MKPNYLTGPQAVKYMREKFRVRCNIKTLIAMAKKTNSVSYVDNGPSVIFREDALNFWGLQLAKSPFISVKAVRSSGGRHVIELTATYPECIKKRS